MNVMTRDRAPIGRVSTRLRSLGWAAVLIAMVVPAIVLFSVTVTAAALSSIWIGIPVALKLNGAVRAMADWWRLWATRTMGVPIARPYRPVPAGGMLTRARALATDPATRRDLAWFLVAGTVGVTLCSLVIALLLVWVFYLVVVGLWAGIPSLRGDFTVAVMLDGTHPLDYVLTPLVGFMFLAIGWWATPHLMRGYARLAARLLGPMAKAQLARRVEQLTTSRADTVDSQAAEVRRIERDLHDGAQARLVALGMSLGMAEEMLANDPQAVAELLAEARRSTSDALTELRDLVRGIHPPVLAERGLEGAIRALALAAPLPVEVTGALPGRPEAPVESAMYFAVAESLTNAAKYGGDRAWIDLRYESGRLKVGVGDDGDGGAAVTAGGGLAGVERRLGAFDGILVVTSPPGGPTTVTMELPCVLSSPRTSPSSGKG